MTRHSPDCAINDYIAKPCSCMSADLDALTAVLYPPPFPPREPVADDALVETMARAIDPGAWEHRDDIAAREPEWVAEWEAGSLDGGGNWGASVLAARALLPILAKVRADATEAAAVVAETMAGEWDDQWRANLKSSSHLEGKSDSGYDIAAAIRAGAKL